MILNYFVKVIRIVWNDSHRMANGCWGFLLAFWSFVPVLNKSRFAMPVNDTELLYHDLLLGLIHTRHFGTQYCNKKILRWKYIFEPWISLTNQGKLLTSLKSRYFIFSPQYLFISIGLIHTRHFDAQYCDKKFVSRYCDKKILQ